MGTAYKFVVKGQNELGYGDASDPITLVSATRPGIVNAPTTEIEGANVKVSWSAPSNGGSVILSYRVQIRDFSGFFRDIDTAVAGLSTTIPLSSLTSEPFNLVQGSLVASKVVALNLIGEGILSPANSVGALIQVRP